MSKPTKTNSPNTAWHCQSVTREQRSTANGHMPVVLWYTGLSGAGKSTIANAVDAKLFEQGCHTYLLDGDNVRQGLNGDLTFSDKDRVENIRRIGEVSKLFVDAGVIVSTAFISPFSSDRMMVRSQLAPEQFIEIYVDTALDVCEKRDPKGLYKKARTGTIKNFTGIDSPYDIPSDPEIHLETHGLSVEQCVETVMLALKKRQIIR